MEIVENIALISINTTMVVQLLSFLLFLWMFNRIMIKPLRQVMGERTSYVDQIRQQIVDADEAFQKVADQIERQERDVRKAASAIRDEIESEAHQSAMAAVGKTKVEISDLRDKAQHQVNAKIADVRLQIQTEAEALADQMVAALINPRGAR